MKLVQSLLLGSAAGFLAVASAQAADLPYRKAAPVEYVRVCDWAGAGFFYIPGTDTCLRVGGNVDYEYEYRSRQNLYAGGNAPIAHRARDETGTWAQGRIELDARTQTGAGVMRTFIQGAFNRASGVESTANGSNADNGVYLGQAYVQWAGLTAGFTQSVFSYYADADNYQTILDPDGNAMILAYTATFGGGFSATLSIEDPEYHAFNSIGSGPVANTVSQYYNATARTSAGNGGEEAPDIVGQINLTQSWGSAQLSGAAHEQNIDGGQTRWGFAGLAGINVKLPVLAPGDNFWLEGQGGVGALEYALNNFTGTRYANQGGNATDFLGAGSQLTGVGGTNFGDWDGVLVGGRQYMPSWFGVTGAFEHYFTPSFHGDLVGSYIDVRYPSAVTALSTTVLTTNDPFTSNWNEFRVGGRLVYSPIKDFSIGVEVLYSRLHEDLPSGFAGVTSVAGIPTINRDLDGYTGTLHVERDF